MPKITEWWGIVLNWINDDFNPWIEKILGEKTKKEFEREFSEAINVVPVAIHSLWVNIKGIFN
ncbi:MAG: hypothetical protein WC998_04195 [Candidatus Paceibacterota bacterium]|jgi:hypothetical protein